MRKLALTVAVLLVAGWLAWQFLPGPEFSPVVLDGPVAAPKGPPSSAARDEGADDLGHEVRDRPTPPDIRRDLRADESRGGHTIARHVGLTDAQLRERLSRESLSAASTYLDLETAERVVGMTLRRHVYRLGQWEARLGPRPNLVLPFAAPNQPSIGRVLRRGSSAAVDAHAAVVVLRWRPDGSYVLTSYPEERARGEERALMLDPDVFPQLAVFVPAYLHQDLEVCGGVEGAIASWVEDTSPEDAAALAGEWANFLEVTAGLVAGERGRLLEHNFGGAWAPRSDEDLHTLTRALRRIHPPLSPEA